MCLFLGWLFDELHKVVTDPEHIAVSRARGAARRLLLI